MPGFPCCPDTNFFFHVFRFRWPNPCWAESNKDSEQNLKVRKSLFGSRKVPKLPIDAVPSGVRTRSSFSFAKIATSNALHNLHPDTVKSCRGHWPFKWKNYETEPYGSSFIWVIFLVRCNFQCFHRKVPMCRGNRSFLTSPFKVRTYKIVELR